MRDILVAKEVDYIKNNRQQELSGARKTIKFISLLESATMWKLMIQYICSNFTFYFSITWMYTYILERFQLGVVETGFYVSITPYCRSNWELVWRCFGRCYFQQRKLEIFTQDTCHNRIWSFLTRNDHGYAGFYTNPLSCIYGIGCFWCRHDTESLMGILHRYWQRKCWICVRNNEYGRESWGFCYNYCIPLHFSVD